MDIIRVLQTGVFTTWLAKLRDENAVRRIRTRMFRMELGNFGDVKLLGDSVSEARIDYGPGYRLYFTRRGNAVVILLCGGDKTTQTADVKLAKRLAKEV